MIETDEANNALTVTVTTVGGALGVEPEASPLALSNPWPNPSAGGSVLALTLPRALPVTFCIADVMGRIVWSAPAAVRTAGTGMLVWPGTSSDGVRARPGVYLAQVRVGDGILTRRIAMIR